MPSSRFVAPKGSSLLAAPNAATSDKPSALGQRPSAPVLSAEAVSIAFQRVQEQLDALSAFGSPRLITSDVILRVGEFVRISPRQGRTLFAKLPKAGTGNAGASITISLEQPNGTLRVSAENPDKVNGQKVATYTVDGLIELVSNGVDRWTSINQLPTTSPASPINDAQYVLGAADVDLPNARVATDSTEIDAVLTTPNAISWALNLASVAFSKLANLTGLSVLGRAANSAGVMAAITAGTARHVLRANAGLTSLEWGYPVSVRANTGTATDAFQLDFLDGTHTTAAATPSAGGNTFVSVNIDVTGLLAAIDSTSIVVSGGTLQRAALTGFTLASQNSNATTTNQVLVVASADASMPNARVTTSSTSVLNDVSVAGQQRFQRAAITGAVTIAQNANASLFGGLGNGLSGNGTATATLAARFVDNANVLLGTGFELRGEDSANINETWSVVGSQASLSYVVNEAATYTWTGSHTFTGLAVTVDVSGAAQFVCNSDCAVASVTGGLWLSAGHTPVVSPSISNGDVLINATNGAGLFAKATPVTNVSAGEVQTEADGDLRINGIGGCAVSASATLPAAPTNGSLNLEADGQVRIFTNGVERLEIEPDGAWQLGGASGTAGDVLTSAGASAPPTWSPSTGRLVRVTRYTSGTALTHTWLAGATTAIIDVVSSGGGGGSVANPAAAQCTLGGGGCSGTWVRALWTIDTASATYTVGAGAAGGASGNTSSFTDGTDTISCPGGPVGAALASGITLAYVLGGSNGATAAAFTGSGFTVLNHNGGTLTLRPNAGGEGLRHSGTVAMSGAGGPSPFSGGGPVGRQSSGVGGAGAAPGAGGAGACSFNAGGAFAGGASLAGMIVVHEYS